MDAVAEAIFVLLDTNKDGKLSREELAAAPAVLLRNDEDDDDMLTPAEVAPNGRPASNMLAGMMAMGMGGSTAAKGPKTLLLLPAQGEPPPELVRRMQEIYGAASDSSTEERTLSRKEMGLDEATFTALDANGDGVLDRTELAGFVKRAPDVELLMRLGRTDSGARRVELVAAKTPLASRTHMVGGLARLDLGRTRADLRSNNDYRNDGLVGILRQQFLAQFKQADKANNGYLDEKQARANRTFGSLFKAMDRDGDGKLYESEVIAYLAELADLQQRRGLPA